MIWVAAGIAAVFVIAIIAFYFKSRNEERAKLRRDAGPDAFRREDVAPLPPRARVPRAPAAPTVLEPVSAPPAAPPPVPPGDGAMPDPRVGDRVAMFAEVEGRSQLSFVVQHRHRYVMQGNEWFEVTGPVEGGREAFVEIWGGSEPGVAAGITGELGLADFGLTEEMLIAYDEQPRQTPPFSYAGSRWSFRASGEVLFHEDCGPRPEGCYWWEFDEVNGKRILYVEKWEGEPFEAGLCTRLDPSEVYVTKG